MAVIEHGAVADAVIAISIMLKVLIMCGYDAEYVIAVKTHQHGFCNCTADIGFSAASELINQYK